MSKKSQKKADKSVDYLHPDGKVPTKPKTEGQMYLSAYQTTLTIMVLDQHDMKSMQKRSTMPEINWAKKLQKRL